MFRTILVANRGEIAVRVLRTVREMGLRGVAVYSDVDRGAPHVAAADAAVALGDPEPAASYLDAAKLLEAARRSGAEAIHPGYGFLSESAAFARAVRDAGLTFIGPPPEAMARLGNKLAARRLLRGTGVPVVPGMLEAPADPARLAAAAEQVGWPVMLKAAAGGGGKGMRLVRGPGELAEAARVAASEARGAFGDGAIYVEKALDRPRHVEVQILADGRGHVVHLGERECSIQRRHQKLLEETPSPALDPELRRRMGEAAIAVARAGGYVGAGTVEFLLVNGAFYFLEVNARLQVEHPITELVTGIDLVRAQIEIAAGSPLALRQEDVAPRGHAIECRIYAEDPARGFSPAPGRVLLAIEPRGPGVRCDAGVVTGTDVPVQYDPILAKVAVHAETRDAAIARMIRALESFVLLGVPTPIELLLDVLRSEPFRAGRTDTGFLADHFATWRPAEDARLDRLAAKAAALAGPAPEDGRVASPWRRLGSWDLAGAPAPREEEARVVSSAGGAHVLELDGVLEPIFTVRSDEGTWVWHRGRARRASSAALGAPRPRRTVLRGDLGESRGASPRPARRAAPEGTITPPMPAVVVAVHVEEGQAVARGDPLVTLSAMKLESLLVAPIAGRVAAVRTRVGASVRPGDVLVSVDPGGSDGG